MPQVTVSINGRVYRVGCDDGQEQAVTDLARDIDRRIETYKSNFGEVGDMRLMLMAAMELGDELIDTRRRLKSLESEVEGLRTARGAMLDKVNAAQEAVAQMLDQAAGRIERLVGALNTTRSEQPGE